MTAIKYEDGAGGTDIVKREVVHYNVDGILTAFNETNDGGVLDKIQIPMERVVMVYE
jgi:hypothetical protein